MRGVAETNKMLRAQELEDLRPKFELTQKDKDKGEELAKKDKEEEEKLKENDTEELIAPISEKIRINPFRMCEDVSEGYFSGVGLGHASTAQQLSLEPSI
jgi:hypothetical protein